MKTTFCDKVNNLPIAKKFFVISVLILLFVLLILNVIIIHNFKNVFIKREKKLFNQWIEYTLKEHLRFFVYKKKWVKNMDFLPLVNEIKKIPNIVYISLYSPEGKLLYSNQKQSNIFNESFKKALNGNFVGKFYTVTLENGKKKTFQVFYYPFTFKNKLKGIIEIYKDPSNLLHDINNLRLIVLGISFIGFLSYIIIFYFIILKIEAKEQKLQEEVHKYQRLSCLGQFSAKMAHELGTPLHVIQGNVELITDVIDNEFIRERIYIVNRQIHKINNIIKNYLYLSKNPIPEKDYVFLKEFLLTLLTDFDFIIPDNIKISTKIEDCTLYTDKDFIEQVIYNFIKNAIDSIGERNGEILLQSYVKDNFIYIEVIDNGKGFPPELKDSLFDPFFTTKKTGKGTGLGLSVCKDLIEALNGDIYCESQKGKTIFGIKLPLE